MSSVEHDGVSACRFEPNGSGGGGGVQSVPNSVIRIKPMNRYFGKRNNKSNARAPLYWKGPEHFSKDLKVDTDSTTTAGAAVLCQMEAKARECLTIAVSTKPGYSYNNNNNKSFYQVIFGATGNTQTILTSTRRGGGKQTALSLVCNEQEWISYWILLTRQGVLYAGVGSTPGEQCIAILENHNNNKDAEKDQDEAMDEDETKQPEHSDDAPTTTSASTSTTTSSPYYIGIGNSAVYDRQAPAPLFVRNIVLTSPSDEWIEQKLSHLQADKLETVALGLDDDDNTDKDNNNDLKTLFREYRDECQKSKARAAKFGIPYQEPSPDAFLPWSQARRLRANPKAGFATGVDLQDPAELAKQEARRKRFGLPVAENTTSLDNGEDNVEGNASSERRDSIPVEQAWDNEAFVQGQRSDPPPSLWKIPPLADSSDAIAEQREMEFGATQAILAEDKIHIFSIDWAAFKQIRTNDIMAYFAIYGPSYVEWLGDLSCNVQFQDKYSAARALNNLSCELPTVIPPEVLVQGTESNNSVAASNLGQMGWRMGRKLLYKKSNDRYGRKGTRARLLMRPATSKDILEQRPTSWPKPPPGFSTRKVLGPGSDDYGKKQHKRRRNQEQRGTDDEIVKRNNGDPLLGALSCGRKSFSAKELEEERSAKRSRTG